MLRKTCDNGRQWPFFSFSLTHPYTSWDKLFCCIIPLSYPQTGDDFGEIAKNRQSQQPPTAQATTVRDRCGPLWTVGNRPALAISPKATPACLLQTIDRLTANVTSHKFSDWQHNQIYLCLPYSSYHSSHTELIHDPSFSCPTQTLADQKNEITWVVTAQALLAKS